MFRSPCTSVVFGVAVLLGSATARAAHVVRVRSDHVAVDLGGRFDARVELDRAYDNPFDPEQILVDALVTTPGGAVHRLPAFWDRDTTRALVGGREVLAATGDGFFHVRYAPIEQGEHQLTVVATDEAGQDVSAATVFEVGPGDDRGFVHVDPDDPMSLAYDNETPYVPVGANVCWSVEPSAGYDMEAYLGSLADAGGTWSRLWLTHFGEGWTIEWGANHPSGYYAGLGRYSVEVAGRLDRVFEEAESKGIGIQLVLWQHSQFETENWSSWSENPYNAANGGPAADSQAFFENASAIALSRRRIRYLVGRYSAYRSLLAWEIMNEMEGVQAPKQVVSAWCADRARDLRAADPYRHLVTTSHLIRPYLAVSSDDASDAYDMTQAHAYGGSFGFAIPKDAQALRGLGKPLLLGEFGLDYLGETELSDPRGVHLAEGSWIALASGFSGGAMSWWWDSYLRPNDLWASQKGLAAFVRKVDLRGLNEPLPEPCIAEDRTGTPIDVFGRRGAAGALLYVRHPDARWEVASTAGIPDVDGGRVRIPCEAGRTCRASSYDTATGVEIGQSTDVQGDATGSAWLSLPAFHGSIALEVRAAPNAPADIESPRGCGCHGVMSCSPTTRYAWVGSFALSCLFLVLRRSGRRPS